MTEAVSTQYVKVYVSSDSGSSWTEIKEVSSVPELGETAATIDVTHLSSETKEYINDIPDWSSQTLDFVCNAMPSGSDDSNVDLVGTLRKNTSYSWKVVYTQVKKQVTFVGQCVHRYGAAAPGAKQDLTLTVTPKSALTESDYTETSSVTTG